MTEQASQVECVPREDIPEDADLPEEIIELLAFRLADEAYAVDLEKVKEIIRLAEITHVPRAPAIIKGISSLRGTIMPIFELRTRLGLRESPSDRRTRIIVMMIEKGLLGFI
ncbi:MAG: chemotaxis protein CheW, partial [Nitrospiria bacterium]